MGLRYLCLLQPHTIEQRIIEADSSKVHLPQIRTSQVCPGEVSLEQAAVAQIRLSQISIGEVRLREIRAWQRSSR
jgi:hypothetical protein